jgi:hypothetical protein
LRCPRGWAGRAGRARCRGRTCGHRELETDLLISGGGGKEHALLLHLGDAKPATQHATHRDRMHLLPLDDERREHVSRPEETDVPELLGLFLERVRRR